MNAGHRATNVLVVEDNPFTLQLLRDVLSELNIDMYAASSAAAAMSAMGTHGDRFTLALVDRLLPDGDGHEVCVALREMRPSLPIVQMTGLPLRDADVSVINATLSKPFDLETLELIVQAFTDGGPPVS